MTSIDAFPEGAVPHWVEVLHYERVAESLEIIVATRRATLSLSGWYFQAAHLRFEGYQGRVCSPPASDPASAGLLTDDIPAPQHYVLAARDGTWGILASGCEGKQLEYAHLRTLADVYAERMGVTRGTLFLLPPEDKAAESLRREAIMDARRAGDA